MRWVIAKALQQLLNPIWLRITKCAGVIVKVLKSNGRKESLTMKLVHSPVKLTLTKNMVYQPCTPLSWTLSKVLRAIHSTVELTQTARYCQQSIPQSNLLKQQGIARDPFHSRTYSFIYSLILVDSEVWSSLDVRGAKVKDDAWKTHIPRLLKQGILAENDAINCLGNNSMQAGDGQENSLSRTGIIHACGYSG